MKRWQELEEAMLRVTISNTTMQPAQASEGPEASQPLQIIPWLRVISAPC